MVSSATFRLPGPLAIAVATVDAMSDGRVELGLGTGWFETEHACAGIPFPPIEIGSTCSKSSRHHHRAMGDAAGDFPSRKLFSLSDSPALPKPVQQPHPPIIVGGKGPRRTPRIAARFADEYNVAFSSVDFTAEAFTRVREACERRPRSGHDGLQRRPDTRRGSGRRGGTTTRRRDRPKRR